MGLWLCSGHDGQSTEKINIKIYIHNTLDSKNKYMEYEKGILLKYTQYSKIILLKIPSEM